MTGLDLAYRSGFVGSGSASPTPFVEPFRHKWWQSALYYMGKPEEWITKSVGNLLSDNPKYDWNQPSYFGQQMNWMELLRDSGVDNPVNALTEGEFPVASTTLGLGLSLLLDPVNYLLPGFKAGSLTAKGVVGKNVAEILRKGEQVGYDAFKYERLPGGALVRTIDKQPLLDKAAQHVEQAIHAPEEAVRDAAIGSLGRIEKRTKEIDDINVLLKQYQQAGARIEDIALAPTKWEQARRGQRVLLGLRNPMSQGFPGFFKNAWGMGDDSTLAQAAITPGSPIDPYVFKAAGQLWDAGKTAATKVLGNVVEKLSGGTMPVIKTARMQELVKELRALMAREDLTPQIIVDRATSLRSEFAEFTPDDWRAVTEQVEMPAKKVHGSSLGEADMDILKRALAEAKPSISEFGIAEGISNKPFPGTPASNVLEGKLSYDYDTGLFVEDVPRALSQWNNSQPKISVGEHEMQLTDRYITVKAHTRGAAEFKPDQVEGILGVAQFRKQETEDGLFLVARKLPRMSKVGTQYAYGGEWLAEHTRNLEVTAAALASKGKSLVGLQPADVVINSEGLMQIVNPDRIADAKSVEAARDISRVTVADFLDRVGDPLGPSREFPLLKTDKTARKAFKQQSELMRVRVADSNVKDGIVSSHDLLDEAANMDVHRDYVRGQGQTNDPLATAKETSDPIDFERANNISAWRQEIRRQVKESNALSIPPIEVTRHPDTGTLFIRDGRDRLTAAILEGVDAIPVKARDWTGEKVDFGAYYIKQPKDLIEAALGQNDTAIQGLKVNYKASREPMADEVSVLTNPEALLALYPDAARVKTTPKEVAELTERLRAGKPVAPVRASIDLVTKKVTLSDAWQAAVARDAGVRDIPVFVSFKRAGRATDKLSPDETMELLRFVRDGKGTYEDIVNDSYKLTSHTGERVLLRNEDLNLGAGRSLLSQFGDMGALSPRGTMKERGGNIVLATVQKYGTPEAAAIKLAEFMDEYRGQGITALADGLNKLTGLSLTDLRNPLIREQVLAHADNLATSSRAYLDDLASRGLFTNKTVQQPARLLRAPHVVESYASGFPLVASGSQTIAELTGYVNSMLRTYTDVDSLLPFQKIRMLGKDGEKTIEIRDLVQSKHFRDAVPRPNTMVISEETKKELYAKGIIYDPTKDDLKGRVLHSATGRPILPVPGSDKSGAFRVDYPEVSFFFTPTGHLFMSVNGYSPFQTMQAVYKEGPIYAAEFGFANKQGIFLNNPFGAVIQRAGVSEIKAMEKRLREAAKKFMDMGFNPQTKLDVTSPFDGSVWKEMYGDYVTLEAIRKDSWKLNLPDDIRNMPLDVHIDAPHITIAIEKPRHQNESIQTLAEWIEGVNDTLYTEEMRRGVPTAYFAPYFARFITVEGRKALAAMNETFRDIILNTPTIMHKESFTKQRLFSDYTTSEVNNLITQLRKYKLDGWQPEQIYEKVIDQLKNKGDWKSLEAIATEMNKISPDLTVGFFHMDPLLSTGKRAVDSASALRRKTVADTLTEKAAAWSGTLDDYEELISARTTINSSGRQIAEAREQVTQLEARINNLGRAPDLAHMKGEPDKTVAELEKAREKLGKLESQRADAEALLRKNKGALANDINIRGRSAYIDGQTAQNLIERGLLDDAEITRQAGNTLIEVPLSKYKDLLQKEGAQVLLFTDEARPLALKYFGSVDNQQGFGRVVKDSWDTFSSWWRSWTLFPVPSYHVRNTFSSFYMAWLGGLEGMESYQVSWNLGTALRRFRNGNLTWQDMNKVMDATSFANANGQVVSLRDLYQEFIASGGYSGGLHFNEFSKFTGDPIKSSNFIEQAVNAGLTPSSELASNFLMDNKLLRKSRSLAASTENFFRFAVFFDAWKKGANFSDAALHMKAVMYDYTDLSLFERGVLRRIFPFYAWSRNNIPRMLETMATDPIKHYRLAKFVNGWENGSLDGRLHEDDELPEWLQSGVVVKRNKNGNLVVKMPDGFIPTYDVFRLMGDPGRTIQEGLTPVLRVPIEQLSNRSLYTKGNIEDPDVPGQVSKSWSLSSLGFSRRVSTEGPLGYFNVILNDALFSNFFRPGKVVSKFIDSIGQNPTIDSEPPGILAGMLDLAFGRAYTIDPNEARAQIYRKWAATRTKLNGLARKAEAMGDDASSQQLRRLLLDLELRKPTNR